MTCPWEKSKYIPLRERFKPGVECEVRGEAVTIYSVDFDTDTCVVRPHRNPVDLVVVQLEDLE